MEIETILAALNYNFDLYVNQNFSGEILIVNQTDCERTYTVNSNVRVIESQSRGIGKNRKIGLENAKGEIIVLADDDEIFKDDYLETIKKAYSKYNDADVIFFDVIRTGDKRREKFKVSNDKKLNYFNSLKFGAVNMTFRNDRIKNADISFDENFGKHPLPFGEDSIFIYDCLKAGLKLYYVNEVIAEVDLENSSWFKGYDKNFFEAKGAQFYRLSRSLYFLLMLQFIIRKRKTYIDNISSFNVLKYMISGKKKYKIFKNIEKD